MTRARIAGYGGENLQSRAQGLTGSNTSDARATFTPTRSNTIVKANRAMTDSHLRSPYREQYTVVAPTIASRLYRSLARFGLIICDIKAAKTEAT